MCSETVVSSRRAAIAALVLMARCTCSSAAILARRIALAERTCEVRACPMNVRGDTKRAAFGAS